MINVTRSSMPLYEDYIEAIKPLWESHWLTNMGKYHQQLELELENYLKVPEVSLTVNGHMALELTIQSFGFSKGSEIITTPFTFVSTTHAIVRNGLKPVFCDVKESDGTIDENKIEDLITTNTVAILPVHVYGNLCNIDKIQEIAEKYDLKVIYDASHAFGIEYKGIGIANFGDASCFSFHATKVFNTIEGGAVTGKNRDLYERLYNLKNFGIRNEELVVTVGANAKMNEFCAIMGLCNLKNFPEAIMKRKEIYNRYLDKIKSLQGKIRILCSQDSIDLKKNYAYFPVIFVGGPQIRDKVYQELKCNGINARKYFYPITSDQACFRNKYKDLILDVARKLSAEILILPLYEELDFQSVDNIVDIIQTII